jgi:vitamin B12 transporter
MSKWLASVLSIMVCLGAWPVQGQEKTPGQEAAVLEEVVITGTRTPVPGKESSLSYTVITGKEIEERQVTRVEEMLRTVPGVNVIQTGSQGGLTDLYIRGGESDHNQVLFNGIKLNNVGGSFNWSPLTVDNLERIEVVRGPMSALYGTDALTGVVQLITKKGHGKPTLSLSSNWGAHSEGHSKNNWIGEQKASLSGSYRQFAYSVAYSRIDDTGILPVNNRFYNNVVNSRLDFDPSEKLSFTFNTLLIDSYFGFPTTIGDRFDPKSVGGPGWNPDQNNTSLDLALGLTAKYWPTSWWENELTLAHTYFDRHYNNPADPVATEADAWGSYFSRDLERHYTLDYHSNFRFGDEARISSTSTVGLGLCSAQLKQRTHGDSTWSGPFSTQDKYRQGSTSWYFQEQLSFWKRLFVTAGCRIEDNRAFNKLEWAPRISVALRFPETDTTLRVAAGRGIKSPTFTESYARTQYTVGNPNLTPEKNTSWEVGLDQYLLQNRLQFGLTYFENHFKDYITFVPSTVWWLPGTFDNIGAVRSRGLEFAVKARPGWGLTLAAAYTHLFEFTVLDDGGLGLTNPYFRAGEHVLRRPRNAFNFDIDGRWDRLGVHLNGLYIGRRSDNFYDWATFTPSRVINGDYFILNLAASYDLVQNWGYVKAVQLLVRVNNLLDRKYYEAYSYSSPRFSAIGGLRLVL